MGGGGVPVKILLLWRFLGWSRAAERLWASAQGIWPDGAMSDVMSHAAAT